jgi:hypothetical protein
MTSTCGVVAGAVEVEVATTTAVVAAMGVVVATWHPHQCMVVTALPL